MCDEQIRTLDDAWLDQLWVVDHRFEAQTKLKMSTTHILSWIIITIDRFQNICIHIVIYDKSTQNVSQLTKYEMIGGIVAIGIYLII